MSIENMVIDELAIAIENGENENENAFDNNKYFSNIRGNIIKGLGATEKDIKKDFYKYVKNTYNVTKINGTNYVKIEDFNVSFSSY